MTVYFISLILVLFASSGLAGQEASSGWNPEKWHKHSERPALMPHAEYDPKLEALRISGSGEFRCNGSFRRRFDVQANSYYKLSAMYRIEQVELPRRSVLVKVDWQNGEGERVGQPDYPKEQDSPESSWRKIQDVVRSPEGAVYATVDLIYRWDEDGSVIWKNAVLEPSAPPPRREVTLATINFRPGGTSGPKENLRLFATYLEKAGTLDADMVCLPEGITLVGTGKTYREVAEPIPGPSTSFLGKLARKHSMYIVAGLLEEEAETIYNTAVLIDRGGQLAGKYRKASLPREEIEGGITPGKDFPVFRTDFGKVGMMICWDVHFPEPARRLAAQGAEIILLPIWGGSELLFPARAIENQVYLVTSSYDAPTGIWDREGKLLQEAPEVGTVALTKIDLSQATYWEWLGNYRTRIPREAPPALEVKF